MEIPMEVNIYEGYLPSISTSEKYGVIRVHLKIRQELEKKLQMELIFEWNKWEKSRVDK